MFRIRGSLSVQCVLVRYLRLWLPDQIPGSSSSKVPVIVVRF